MEPPSLGQGKRGTARTGTCRGRGRDGVLEATRAQSHPTHSAAPLGAPHRATSRHVSHATRPVTQLCP